MFRRTSPGTVTVCQVGQLPLFNAHTLMLLLLQVLMGGVLGVESIHAA